MQIFLPFKECNASLLHAEIFLQNSKVSLSNTTQSLFPTKIQSSPLPTQCRGYFLQKFRVLPRQHNAEILFPFSHYISHPYEEEKSIAVQSSLPLSFLFSLFKPPPQHSRPVKIGNVPLKRLFSLFHVSKSHEISGGWFIGACHGNKFPLILTLFGIKIQWDKWQKIMLTSFFIYIYIYI